MHSERACAEVVATVAEMSERVGRARAEQRRACAAIDQLLATLPWLESARPAHQSDQQRATRALEAYRAAHPDRRGVPRLQDLPLPDQILVRNAGGIKACLARVRKASCASAQAREDGREGGSPSPKRRATDWMK